MNAKVTRLWDKGVPIPTKDRKAVVGTLMYEFQDSLGYVMTLMPTEGKNANPLLAPLIHVTLPAVRSETFLFSGLEADPDNPKSMGPLYSQQWSVMPIPVPKVIAKGLPAEKESE